SLFPHHPPPTFPTRRSSCLLDLLPRGLVVAGAGGVDHAVSDVLLEEVDGDRVQRGRRGGDLGEDVDAVLVVIDHLPDAADLAFDPLHPPREGVLLRGVSMVLSHAHTVYPYRV